jgi:cell wall-associated NlpC family hydrolase
VIKVKILKGFRRLVPLLLTGILLSLCGCWSNSKVTYIPREDNTLQEQLDTRERIERLKNYFTGWMGTRYCYGGLSRKGVDCSGLTLLAYRELFGKQLPRTVQEQVRQGTAVDRDFLQPGDLVFFRTGMYQKHVGIYLEDDLFIHASRSSGVRVSRLNDNYWQERFWQAKRL